MSRFFFRGKDQSASGPDTETENDRTAQLHEAGKLMTKVVEAWVNTLPWLKYTTRNKRVVASVLRLRNESTYRACLQALVLNHSRSEHQPRMVRDTSRRSCFLMAWCTWVRTVLDTKNRTHIFKCVQMRAASRQVNRVASSKLMDIEFRKSTYMHFCEWRQMIRRRRRLLRTCRDLTRRWHRMLLHTKFRWWVVAFTNWLDLRESVGELFQRVIRKFTSHSFLTWAAFVLENQRLLVGGTKALLRWSHFLIRQALTALIVHAKSTRRIQASYRAVLSRWRGDRLEACFRHLKHKARQRVALRAMNVRALLLWIRSARMKYLLRWWDNVHEAHRLTYAMRKAKHLHMTGRISLTTMIDLRNIHRLVSAATRHWAGRVRMVTIVRDHTGIWDKVRKDKILRACMESWQHVAKEKRQTLKRALEFIFRNGRSFFLVLLDQWRFIAVRNRKHQDLAYQKSGKYFRSSYREMLQRWRTRIMVKRAVWRLSWKIASSGDTHLRKTAFQAWRQSFAYNKRNILTVSRALARSQFGEIGDLFSVWHETAKRARQLLRLWRGHESKRNTNKRSDCFFHWRAFTTSQKRLVVAAAKVIVRRDLISLAGYFCALARLTDKWKRISIWCDKMERSTTRWAFFLWCDEKARFSQKERKWQNTAIKMMQTLVKRLFTHWRSTHIETNLHRRTTKRWALRMGRCAEMGPWFQHWNYLIRQRNILNRTLGLGKRREIPKILASVLKAWIERADYRRMVWSVVRRIKIRWFAMVGTQAFYIWRRYLSSKANVKALLHHVAIHRHFHFCASYFGVWEEQARAGTKIQMLRQKDEVNKQSLTVSELRERLEAAELLAHSAVTEKHALVDELAQVREECASAYRVIEALNQSEQGSKSRIDNLVSRLDEASYMYDRLEETQNLVKELQTLRRTSTDEINRLQLEWDVCKAEKDGVDAELQDTRAKLNQMKHSLVRVESQREADQVEFDDFSANLSRHYNAMQLQFQKVEQDLANATDKYHRNLAANTLSMESLKALENDNQSLDSVLSISKREKEELNLRISVLENSVASEKRRILDLILPQNTDHEKMETLLLVFKMDLKDIKAKELDFVDEVAAHVSNALGVQDTGWVSVTSLQSGSIKARLRFGPGPASNGLLPIDAVNIVQAQANRPESLLLRGDLGSKVKGVESPTFSASSNQTHGTYANGQEESRISDDIIALTKKSPAVATRSAGPTGAQRAVAPSENVERRSIDAVLAKLTLKLGLDFRVAGTEGSSQRTLFASNLTQDLSLASGLPPTSFDIKKVSPGSVIVELEIPLSPAVPNPMAVAANLEKQVYDPNSALRNGATTRYTTNIAVEQVPVLRQSANSDSISAPFVMKTPVSPVTPNDRSMLRESELIDLIASEKSMRERIYALESLVSEKDGLIHTLGQKSKSSEMLREDIAELQRILDNKENENTLLTSRIQDLEADILRLRSNDINRHPDPRVRTSSDGPAFTQNSLSSEPLHSLLQFHGAEGTRDQVPVAVFKGSPETGPGLQDQPPIWQKDQAEGPVRTTPKVAAAAARAETEQLLQFQSTLRKAEAALAEQSTIVEAQASELAKVQKAVESTQKQKDLLQQNLERTLADLAEQKEIADSVTVQVQKLSHKNAELTKEIRVNHHRTDDFVNMHERLRKELENALNAKRHEGSVSQTASGDLVLEIDAERQRAQELQRFLDDANRQLEKCNEARRLQHEAAILERQRLQTEMKDAVDRQQLVINRLMHIIDTHRERRNNDRDRGADGQIEELKQRATAAESAVQESMAMYQMLKGEMMRQEAEKVKLKQALDASVGGDVSRAQALISNGKEPNLDAYQKELNESLLLMRAKTRWECLSRAQEGLNKRRDFKLLDSTFSCWANQTEEQAFEKLLGRQKEGRSGEGFDSSFDDGDPGSRHVVTGSGKEISASTIGTNSKPCPKFASPWSSPEKIAKDAVVIAKQPGTVSTRNAPASQQYKSPPPSPHLHSPHSPPPPPRRRGSVSATLPGSGSRPASRSPSSRPSMADSPKASPILTHQAILSSMSVAPIGFTARSLDVSRASQQEQPPQPATPPPVSAEVLQLVGLKLMDKMPPYVVENGNGLMDVFGIYQDDAQYSNQPVQAGDTLLFVDGNDVAGLGPKGIVSSLRGQPMSQVHLVFSSRQNASLFRITVLRLVTSCDDLLA